MRITIEISKEIRDRIKKIADDNERTINDEASILCEVGLNIAENCEAELNIVEDERYERE